MTVHDEVAKELRALESSTQKTIAAKRARRNRRYVATCSFEDLEGAGDELTASPIQKSARITVDRPFYCASLEACLRIIGSSSVNGGASEVFDVPLTTIVSIDDLAIATLGVFDFFWSIRDSFGDREWTKGKQPSAILESTPMGPLQLPKRQYLPAGTEVIVDIDPLFCLAGSTISGEGLSIVIKSILVEMSFVGYET